MLKIHERQPVGHATILDVSGKLTIGAGDDRLREAIDQLMASGVDRILLNLADVQVIDSSGVGELVAAHTKLRHRGGQLAILRLSPRVGDVLRATRLLGILDIHERESDALRALS